MSKEFSVHYRTRNNHAGGAYTTNKQSVNEIIEEMNRTKHAEIFKIYEVDGERRTLIYDSETMDIQMGIFEVM
ncbi:hypothetical protein [Macrococcoides canis]|uniref:hypothetical protein n=1 Tax=Macrococcoides canis TaxID=1855823 RepID=UPI0020B78303|nr:hypothetical protein [Macrococcus canis]UTG99335.1 hypothetical protein KFV04_07430 [Macrococcus canis]